eukprot:13618946-Alexandrium_andersonii.AAC.1
MRVSSASKARPAKNARRVRTLSVKYQSANCACKLSVCSLTVCCMAGWLCQVCSRVRKLTAQ